METVEYERDNKHEELMERYLKHSETYERLRRDYDMWYRFSLPLTDEDRDF